MNSEQHLQLTAILRQWQQNQSLCRTEGFNVLYSELRKIARSYLVKERTVSLQTDLLVNEALIRLKEQFKSPWQSQFQFYSIASRAIKQYLIEHARARNAIKRGRGEGLIPLQDVPERPITESSRVEALRDALVELKAIKPRSAAIIELRFFGGLSNAQIAILFQKSISTVKRDWEEARDWLKMRMNSSPF